MVRPARFTMNAQTAVDNFYQDAEASFNADEVQKLALAEFDAFVEKLRAVGVHVDVLQDTPEPHTPDSIFPNNWISLHESGTVCLYPMKAENRRLERKPDIADTLSSWGFRIDAVNDITASEERGVYLEGTGAIIFDHPSKTAFMARSQRADEALFRAWCEDMDYTPVVFSSFQDTPEGRQPIYHTNVMMCVADSFVVICLDTIDNANERKAVVDKLTELDKEIIEITEAQKHQFAGNMLQVGAAAGPVLVMSQSAYKSLTTEQISAIESHCPILYADLAWIERLGGGSARCMIAENYLPTK